MNGFLGGGRTRGSAGATRRATIAAVAASALLLMASTARADLDVGRMVERWQLEVSSPDANSGDPFHALSRRGDGTMRLLVTERTPSGSSRAPRADMVPIHHGTYAWAATAEEVATLVVARPDLRVTWSAPRHVLLDQAVPLVHADVAHTQYGLSGKGVVVGIVDTGLDISHADLRRADGTSRIAWLLDMSKGPIGLHPELEQAYQCSSEKAPCAVYSGADLDRLIANGVMGDEPRDDYGHGTHVTSLAAGNGLASAVPKYIGVAPEATIVAVRATRDGGGIVEDPDILSAVGFIFDVAEHQLQMPAVVNLSLGGDFGAHDGTSELERGLAKFVGAGHPGRSIVVAGGNSGLLFYPNDMPYPSPLGIHSVVQIPAESSVRVPILAFASAEPKIPSQLYIWVAMRPFDELKVGLESATGDWIAPVNPGPPHDARDPTGEYTARLQNGVTESDDPSSVDHSGAAVIIEGPFTEDQVFALRFEGRGTASIWVQPSGGIEPAANGIGALLPGAQREGTINIPGTSSAIIAVGASLNRLQWTDVTGRAELASQYIANYFRLNEVLPFSAAGPNAVDDLKPDLVAPGGWVAGAMSSLTDPRTAVGADAMFTGSRVDCYSPSDTCLVVDDQHALSTGTSMASPIVAGAIALLLERDPQLTQSDILRTLQAGATTVGSLYASPSQVGAGLLDVENTLRALDGVVGAGSVDTTNSWIGLGNSYVHPDPDWPVEGLVHLRDAANRAVDIAINRLSLRVDNGRVKKTLGQVMPGYYRFTVAGEERTAGEKFSVTILLDGQPLLTETRDIAVDAPNKKDQRIVAGRGCSVALGPRPHFGALVLLLALGVAVTRRRVREARGK